MKTLYALVPAVAALLLVQAIDIEKKGSFDLEFTGSTSVEYTKTPPGDASVRLTDLEFAGAGLEPEHTKIPPESVRLIDAELFGRHLRPEHTKTPPEGSAVTLPLA